MICGEYAVHLSVGVLKFLIKLPYLRLGPGVCHTRRMVRLSVTRIACDFAVLVVIGRFISAGFNEIDSNLRHCLGPNELKML